MEISEPRLRALLTQADRNASYGKRAAAETMYRQIIAEAPSAHAAWAGLGTVLTDPDEKREAFEEALKLEPGYEPAEAGLAALDGNPLPESTEQDPVAASTPSSAASSTAPAPLAAEPLPAASSAAATTATTSGHIHEITEESYEMACYRHPDRSTSLRCYNCQKPICISCANKTPVGYMCPDCVREAEDAFFNNKPIDYLIAALVSFPISLLAGFILANFGRGFFIYIIIFLVSGAVGSFIGRITKRAIGNRRGRYLPALVVAMMILGVVIPALPIILAVLSGNLGAITALIGPAIYLFVASSAAYWQMR